VTRRRRRAGPLVLLAALGVATLATSAIDTGGATASAQRTLVVAVPGPFGGCDPGSATTTAATAAVLGIVLPSAFLPGPTDTPVGDTYVISQAELVDQTPQTVDYTIAPTAVWPDGRGLVPGDLVRTWRERRHDRVVADLGYREVASVRPTAAGTGVAVVFRRAYADWASLFNLVVPAATARSHCALPSASLDPSIGPYELVSATRTTIELRENPRWPGPTPAYAQVDVTTDPAAPPPAHGADPRLAYLAWPTLPAVQAVTSTGAYAARTQHDTTIVSLDFAVREPSALAPWLRQALAHDVDRAAVVAAIPAPIDDTAAAAASHLVGQGEPRYPGATGTPVSAPRPAVQGVPGASGEAAYGDTADPGAADAALRAHGYERTAEGWVAPDLQVLSVCLAVPRSGLLQETGELLAAQLRSHGVVVDERTRPSVSLVARDLRRGTCATGVVRRTSDGFTTHAAASWLAPVAPVPVGLAWTGVDDPVVEADAAAASGVLNPDVAAPTWDAMDARLWDLMVSLPLYSPPVFVGWSPSVAGVLTTDTLASFVAQVPTLLPASTKP
jgi:peptide/nickel transport system substrate-binding protein